MMIPACVRATLLAALQLQCFTTQLRQPELLPETVEEALPFCSERLIKHMGEAKTLSIRLKAVKHQEKLSALDGQPRAVKASCCMYVKVVCLAALFVWLQAAPCTRMQQSWRLRLHSFRRCLWSWCLGDCLIILFWKPLSFQKALFEPVGSVGGPCK